MDAGFEAAADLLADLGESPDGPALQQIVGLDEAEDLLLVAEVPRNAAVYPQKDATLMQHARNCKEIQRLERRNKTLEEKLAAIQSRLRTGMVNGFPCFCWTQVLPIPLGVQEI